MIRLVRSGVHAGHGCVYEWFVAVERWHNPPPRETREAHRHPAKRDLCHSASVRDVLPGLRPELGLGAGV